MADPDSPTPLSAGITWAYRVTAIGLEFGLPALLGYALDRRWDSSPVATLIGACLGFAAGMVHLVQLASKDRRPPSGRGRAGRG